MTASLDTGGSVAATYIGEFLGWDKHVETAGLIGVVVGAAVLLLGHSLATKK